MSKNKKDKKRKKQTITIFFRDGKKDVIPQKYWDDYEVHMKGGGNWLHLIKKEQWVAGYNLKDVTAYTVG